MNEANVVQFEKLTHEIKNPLAVCSGYLEMLSQSNPKMKQKYIQIIKEEIKRSISIINDFNHHSFDQLELEEFDITYLLEEIQETLNSLFQNHNSKIILLNKNELYFKGDYNKMKQVFMNIIKNAYEAKEEKKMIIVITSNIHPNYYQISITDNGKGMSKKELKKIDKEYYTTKKNGNGLGIPYCKEIIHLHGGQLYYDSRKKIGTKVTLILPK